MRVPFDSLCLARSVAEAQSLVGGTVARVYARESTTVVFAVSSETERHFLVSADPVHARAHLVARRPERPPEIPPFVSELRTRLFDARLVFVRQRGLDRVLEVGLSGPEGDFQLVAELMGKHANLMLVDRRGRVATAAKWVGPRLSRRPILPNRPYEPPPFEARPLLTSAKPGDELLAFEGASPFLVRLIGAGLPLEEAQAAFALSQRGGFLSDTHGVYPLPLNVLGWQSTPREVFSFALETVTETRIVSQATESARSSLTTQLRRVLLARETALAQVRESVDAALRATELQEQGQLILAYQGQIGPGDAELSAWDMQGHAVTIRLDPTKTPVENAERLFHRAKRAKARAGEMSEMSDRLEADRLELEAALRRLEDAPLDAITALRAEADRRRWLQRAPGAPVPREERPFAGHAVRELLSPAGWRVLYGENATANDYLTTKVGKPNDYWLHVRGAPSAHVLITTNNQPDRVQKEDLLFAARVAVRHSPSKHAGYVAVDYTLKKYVRKPRGSAPGLAVYTHERTLHLESDR